MPLTIEEVEYFAELARLDLKPEEKERFRRQLSAILDHFRRLQEVNTEEVEPTSTIISPESILREDNPRPGLTLEDLLHNAPQKDQNQFRLPPVFE
jgi:aspartyl-tRNA(Asn)/glutamyl-tRNA(Gln) amidotransferase subunit C